MPTSITPPPIPSGLSYTERVLGGTWGALVVTPTIQINWDRALLEQLRRSTANSARDAEIVSAFTTAPSKPRVFVFRGANDDATASVRFASELDDHEREELGDLLFASHVRVLRSLLAAGAQLFVYVDWPRCMLALFGRAMGRLADARSAALAGPVSESRAGILRMDLWIFSRLTLYCAQPFADVVGEFLPEHMPLLDRRAERVARLTEGIPREVFELVLEGDRP
ncbi:hypothetical protein DB30_07906 [Enhygromyxa salina]|uniref:Uncharacterized protein n=1 Tax=Enhygromyxa salina TaxID=215803 RepID=A0A0C2CVF4_9BACT|nr:hypothetical protein [Enhygromyxa salina]KIG13575.1 hypothetical protein DB30_07906 [Enhygromyxa salina]